MPLSRRAVVRVLVAILVLSTLSPVRASADTFIEHDLIGNALLADATFVSSLFSRATASIHTGARNISATLASIPEQIASLVTGAAEALADRLATTSVVASNTSPPIPSREAQAAAAAAKRGARPIGRI